MQAREKGRGYFIMQAFYFLSDNNTSLKCLDIIYLKLADHLGLFQRLTWMLCLILRCFIFNLFLCLLGNA